MMKTENLDLELFGQIKKANLKLDNLTFLIGPQASGKSIVLQLLKLLIDKKHIRKTLNQYGYNWSNRTNENLDRFFGEGMHSIWNGKSKICYNNDSYKKNFLDPMQGEKPYNAKEQLFYIPAQRVLCLQNGWPRFFSDYDDGIPYVIKHFSESLRRLLENGNWDKDDDNTIFPQNNHLQKYLRKNYSDNIFNDGIIKLDKRGKKKFKLEIDRAKISYMAWSAGQKEFMPLLLSFYWLCPAGGVGTRESIKYIVIEEPEMGLHPKAITSLILQIMDLMYRGYKVLISTHSPIFLEFAWAMKSFKDKQAKAQAQALFDLFDIRKNPKLEKIFNDILENKIINTYYFKKEEKKVIVEDISSLDAGDNDKSISEWGGISEFAGKASDIVGNYFEKEEDK